MATKKPFVPGTSPGNILQIQAGDFIDPAVLGSGTADGTTVLFGNNTWAVPAGGGGGQPLDAGLTSIAALTGAGYIKASATDTYSHIPAIPQADVSGLVAALDSKASLVNPVFTSSVSIDNFGTATFLNFMADGIVRGTVNVFPGIGEMHLTYSNASDVVVGDLLIEETTGWLTYNGNRVWDAGNLTNPSGTYQPIDATLTALAGQDWVLNSMPLGSGANTMSQLALGVNTIPGRSSTGNVVAKGVTDAAFTALSNMVAQTAFTPVVSGATSAGAGTYSSQTGKYTRFGTLVFFKLQVTQTAHTGTGGMRVSLPIAALADSQGCAVCVGQIDNLTTGASTQVLADIPSGASYVRILSIPVGGGATTNVAVDVACTVNIAGFYFI